jgi:hypothetical protein
MELALGYLRWTPDVFYRATLRELIAGMDGLVESKGGTTPRQRAAMVKDLKALMAEMPSGEPSKHQPPSR